jgi:hypothetical protein
VKCNLLRRRKIEPAMVSQLSKEITILLLEVGNWKIRCHGISLIHSSVDLYFRVRMIAVIIQRPIHVVAKGSRNVKQTILLCLVSIFEMSLPYAIS